MRLSFTILSLLFILQMRLVVSLDAYYRPHVSYTGSVTTAETAHHIPEQFAAPMFVDIAGAGNAQVGTPFAMYSATTPIGIGNAATSSTHVVETTTAITNNSPLQKNLNSQGTEVRAQPSANWLLLPLPETVFTQTISTLLVDPYSATKLLLATKSGLYTSHNAGQTWQRNQALGERPIFDLVQAELDPQRLYVRTWQTMRSDDGGITWQILDLPVQPCGLAGAPSDPERLYARHCDDDALPPVSRSEDGGLHWIIPTTSLTITFDMLAVAPDQPNILVGTNYNQVWRSTDGGDSWLKASTGRRYFAKPFFDHQLPGTLYLAHWTGLLRSQDYGAHWEDSDAARELLTAIPFAAEKGAIIGGNQLEAWYFQLDANQWQAESFRAPAKLQRLWGSSYDPTLFYALSDEGLWHLDLRPPQRVASQVLFLPIVQNMALTKASAQKQALCALACPSQGPQTSAETASMVGTARPVAAMMAITGTVAEQALGRANVYRARVGVMPLLSHPALLQAAENHTNYLVTNYADASAWLYGAHGEVEGKPFFTGKWPVDRIAVANYPWAGGSEVIHGVGDPVASIDGWMATVYHRFPIIDPYNHFAGYANHDVLPVQIDVLDFGTGPQTAGIWLPAAPFPLAYPIDGQIDVPTAWNGAEIPDPLPKGTRGPVGYPFTLQAIGGKMTIEHADLRTLAGEQIAIHPNPPDCESGRCLAVIAVAPLLPQTSYVVTASGTVGDVPFDGEWHFTTRSDTTPIQAAISASSPALLQSVASPDDWP